MKLILSYTDKKGAHTTMPILPAEVEDKLKYLHKRRFESVLWEDGNREYEIGWVWKHPESGWSWCFDNDIFK